jgi:hypothetical protein
MLATSTSRFGSTDARPTEPSLSLLCSRLAAAASRLVAALDAIRPSWLRKRYDVGTPITWRCDCD